MPKPTVSTATAAEIADAVNPSRICPQCTRDFIPARYWQRFCTAKCRSKAHTTVLADLRAENTRLKLKLKDPE